MNIRLILALEALALRIRKTSPRIILARSAKT